MNLTESEPLQNILRILKKKGKNRNEKHIIELANFFNKKKFFSDLTDNNRNTEIYKVMEVVELEAGTDLFRYGDKADYFYYILKGEVDVLIPSKPPNIEKEGFSYEKLKLIKVNSIKTGGTFGELSFIMAKPRAATIRASEHTIIARCDKNTYMKCIRSKELKKIEQTIAKFNSLMPEKLDKTQLTKFLYYVTTETRSFNQLLTIEGLKAEYVYLIIKGSVKVI